MEKFHTIEEAIEEILNGRMVIVVDDEDRENEGDLIMATSKVTPDSINFMAKYARGLICVAMNENRLEALNLHPMVPNNTARMRTSFTVSVDALRNTTTGISAHDRATTIEVLINPDTMPEDLGRPGHIFPLRATPGGILRRAGHTEAAVDLTVLAGLYPAGILCEIMDDDGSMAQIPQLFKFAEHHNLKVITISDLIKYRRKREKLVEKITTIKFPTKFGNFKLHLYNSYLDERNHIALVKGDIDSETPTLVRAHSECLTGDVFHSLRCDCGDQLEQAIRMIEQEGKGVLLYIRQEGRGIGLENKIKAYKIQERGKDTVEANNELGFKADLRDYGIGAQILVDLGVRKINLLTNNPKKVVGLDAHGLEIVSRIPIEIAPNKVNKKYLMTKRDKLGHLILQDD